MRIACVLLLVAACGAAVPPLPSKGGPAWTELESEHFTLWTDAPVARGRELVRQMEHLHQVVFGVAFPELPTAGKIFVIALRDGYELGAYVPDGVQAFAWPEDNLVGQPVIVLAADTNDRDGHVATHELAHVISHVHIHHQPVWFAEGLAQFFETVDLDPDRAVVAVGEPLKHQVAAVRQMSLLPGDALFACQHQECRDTRFYMTSALLFSYLANTHPAELLRFEELLAARSPDAWRTAFPALPPAALDRELRTWAVQGQHRVWHFNARLREPAIRERVLVEGDVLAARALLRYSFHANQPNPDETAALAADPTNVLAHLLALDRTHAIAATDARATAAAHPDDWRAWYLVMRATQGDEANAARERACTLAAANPAADLPEPCSRPARDDVPGAGEHGGEPVRPQ